MPTTVETIREGFPYPSIDQQPGCPTYTIISEVHKKLKKNSASVHSNLGGGQHGLLGLTLQDRTYTTLTGVTFILPTNPGLFPISRPAVAALKYLNLNARTKKSSANGKRRQEPIRHYNNNYSLFLTKNIFGGSVICKWVTLE